MFHAMAGSQQAYACPNQYTFGSELIAAVCFPTLCNRLSRQVIWLPDGHLVRIFSSDGDTYSGAPTMRSMAAWRKSRCLPEPGQMSHLRPSGENGVNNPDSLILHIFPGENNRFELYEDDGEHIRLI